MHEQVYEWFSRQLSRGTPAQPSVLEVGSLDINGSVRPLLAHASHYHGLDLVAGPGVDEVADAATWTPPRRYDLVVCAEVLEHAPAWRDVLATMWRATAPGGTLLMTCATDPRAPHSAVDGLEVRPDEYYANVRAADVRALVQSWRTRQWSVECALARGDLYLRVDRSPAD